MRPYLENTIWCGKERHHFTVIDSTNKKAKELAQQGCAHGTLVTADAQQAGIGRRGRSWSSEEGAGIYMSLVLRPQIETGSASRLTLIAALAVAKAIEGVLKAQGCRDVYPQIKWPNDIVLNKKKICGILTEMSLNGADIDFIVIGIGINVLNQSFAKELQATASSLFLETGVKLEKEELIEAVWQQFETYYKSFIETEDLQGMKAEYESLLANKNNKVNVLDPNGEYEGIAKGITNTGELLVQTEQGICEVASGEVSVRGIYGYV